MDLIEIIKNRKSCRTYNQIPISPAEKNELETFIKANNKPLLDDSLNLKIIERKPGNKEMRLNYGAIKGHNTYIAGKSKATQNSRVNYGYLMEKVILKATEMNISTCWIGYFDASFFNEISIEPGYEIPGIVIIGHSDERPSLLDKFSRFSVNASKRHDWGKLFFDYKLKTPLTAGLIQKYSDSLEMLRLAPSAGNTQPWRVFFNYTTDEYHFFKKPINERYEKDGLHDIDMGIALAHFELTTLYKGLSGRWIKHTDEIISSFNDMQYIISWKCE